jgi:hypothetical protein
VAKPLTFLVAGTTVSTADAVLAARVGAEVRLLTTARDVLDAQREAGAAWDGVGVLGPSGASIGAASAALDRWQGLVSQVGPALRWASPDVGDGWRVIPLDADIASGRALIPATEPPATVLARLRLCRDLDDVLAIAPPARLVRLLFGSRGSKDLVEPLGEALLDGLVRLPARFAPITLAVAAAPLLDPTRLATVLSWRDDGLGVLGTDDVDGLAADLAAVLTPYPPARRVSLLGDLWSDVHARSSIWRHARQQRQRWLLDHADAAAAAAVPFDHIVPPTLAINDHLREALGMWSRHQVGNAEYFMVDQVRAASTNFEGWADGERPPRGDEPPERLIARFIGTVWGAERLRLRIGGRLDERRQQWPDAHDLIGKARRLLDQLAMPREGLLLVGRDGDPTLGYDGLHSDIDADIPAPPWNGIERLPLPPTVAAGVGAMARVFRLGATPPRKPGSWDDLRHGVAVFHAFGAATVPVRPWVAALDRTTLDASALGLGLLEVRAPEDLDELDAWGRFMQNCVASHHGGDVADGREVILGLFAGGALTWNVGCNADGHVFEINSRFNDSQVPDGLQTIVEAAILAATTAAAIEDVDARVRPATHDVRPRRRRMAALVEQLGARFDEDLQATPELADPLQGLVRLARAGGAGVYSWRDAVTVLLRTADERFADLVADAVRTGGMQQVWEASTYDLLGRWMQTTVPIDPATATHLRSMRWGDRAARVGAATAVADAVRPAYLLGRVQRHVLDVFGRLATDDPLLLAPSLRAPSGAAARWSFALVTTARSDEGAPVPEGRWFDLDPERWLQAWDAASDLDASATDRLADRSGVTDRQDRHLVQVRRAEAGLPPVTCPLPWLP